MTRPRLSQREAEIAELVRQGLTNKEIAGRLFISERTVEGHIQQLHNKLGFNSRAQVAAWVAEGGLQSEPVRSQRTPPTALAPVRGRRWPILAMAGTVLVVAVAVGVYVGAPRSPTPPGGRVSVLAEGATYYGVAVDRAGNVYTADPKADTVLRVAAGGDVGVFAGTGVKGFAGDGGPARQAEFASPSGVAVAPDGGIYVIDEGRLIRWIGPDGTVTTVAGIPADTTAGPAPALDAFIRPYAITVDVAGNAVFSDGPDVKELDRAAGVIRTVAGTGTVGYSGDHGPAVHAQFGGGMRGVSYANGQLYVADSANNAIRVIDSRGLINTVVGPGGRLNLPQSVAVARNGDIYIANTGSNEILRWRKGSIARVAGTGRAGVRLGATPLETELYSPSDIVLDAAGNLYVDDQLNKRLLKLTLPG